MPHEGLDDHIKFLTSINDDHIRPCIVPFEGPTTVAPAPPTGLTYSVPEDRHLFLYGIRGFIEPDNSGVIAATEANLPNLVTLSVVVNNDQNLIIGPQATLNMAQILGEPYSPLAGEDFKFPYHIRPKVTMEVVFALAAAFPAAVRRLGVHFLAVLVKVPGSGM